MRPTMPPVTSEGTKAPNQARMIEGRNTVFISEAFSKRKRKDFGMEVGALRTRGMKVGH